MILDRRESTVLALVFRSKVTLAQLGILGEVEGLTRIHYKIVKIEITNDGQSLLDRNRTLVRSAKKSAVLDYAAML